MTSHGIIEKLTADKTPRNVSLKSWTRELSSKHGTEELLIINTPENPGKIAYLYGKLINGLNSTNIYDVIPSNSKVVGSYPVVNSQLQVTANGDCGTLNRKWLKLKVLQFKQSNKYFFFQTNNYTESKSHLSHLDTQK